MTTRDLVYAPGESNYDYLRGFWQRVTAEEWAEMRAAARGGWPAAVRTEPTRNAPCSCGSGRKYKRCCGE